MNTGSVLGLIGLVIVGVIIADFIANPTGTSGLLSGLNSIASTGISGLLGKPPSPAPGTPVKGKL